MIRFDRSYLPPAQFEFVVIADTHYMLDMAKQPVEFESSRQQTDRAYTNEKAFFGDD